MDNQTILDRLIAAKPLAELVLEHDYLPSGNYNTVVQLSEIYKHLYKGNVQLHCGNCVKEMFVRLYKHYYPDAIKETEVKQMSNGERKTKKVK